MQKVLKQKTPSRSSSLTCALGVSFLCLGVLVGNTFAQSPPANPEPKAEPKGKPKAASPTEPATSAKPKIEPARKVGSRPKGTFKTDALLKSLGKPTRKPPGSATAGGRRGPTTFTADPNAKWACNQQTVDLGKVWRGTQMLTFGFDIRNEGTGDLKIKARGG